MSDGELLPGIPSSLDNPYRSGLGIRLPGQLHQKNAMRHDALSRSEFFIPGT